MVNTRTIAREQSFYSNLLILVERMHVCLLLFFFFFLFLVFIFAYWLSLCFRGLWSSWGCAEYYWAQQSI